GRRIARAGPRLPARRIRFINSGMRAEGIGRGASLLSAGARVERSPGWVARLIAPGFHKVLDRIDAGLESGTIMGRPPDGRT
ncbi:hypothetical protein CWI54_27500, partial [Escherichia coli]